MFQLYTIEDNVTLEPHYLGDITQAVFDTIQARYTTKVS